MSEFFDILVALCANPKLEVISGLVLRQSRPVRRLLVLCSAEDSGVLAKLMHSAVLATIIHFWSHQPTHVAHLATHLPQLSIPAPIRANGRSVASIPRSFCGRPESVLSCVQPAALMGTKPMPAGFGMYMHIRRPPWPVACAWRPCSHLASPAAIHCLAASRPAELTVL